MNPLYTKHSSLIAFIVISFSCFGQFSSYTNEQPLLKHLAKEQLYTERIFLLTHLQDSAFQILVNLEKAWTYHASNNFSLSQKHYQQVSFDSIIHYRFSDDYLILLFKQYELKKISELIKNPLLPKSSNAHFFEKVSVSIDLMELKVSPSEIETIRSPSPLKEAYGRAVALQRKSLVLSGLYSALVPGLGKAYYGKKREAWGAFASNLLFGVQTFESYKKAGVGSFRFIFFSTGFSLFYLSNIYGSVAGLLKARRDWRKQLHHEVCTTYFISNSSTHPHYR